MCRSLAVSALAFCMLVASAEWRAPRAQIAVVETFTATGTMNISLPGTRSIKGVVFDRTGSLTTLDFTPGSVTFQGQPIDFDGTEADFLATTSFGTLDVASGPTPPGVRLDAGGFGGIVMSGPGTNASGVVRDAELHLGPNFTENFFDLLPGVPYVTESRLDHWQSPVVPELNGAFVRVQMEILPTFVDPNAGIVQFDANGRIVAELLPELSGFVFSQLDWLDEDGILQIPDSSWGMVEFQVTPHPTVPFYLNIVGDISTGPVWLVQNFPIFPQVTGSGDQRQGLDLDLTDFGLTEGEDLPSLLFNFDLVQIPAQTMPAVPPPAPVTVTPRNRFAFGSKLPSGPLTTSIGSPSGVKNAATAKCVIQHKDVPEVQEEGLTCLAGAFARSISWLNTTYGLGIGKTGQQIYSDLRALKVGSTGEGATTYEEDVKSKDRYLKENSDQRGVTKVLDLDNAVGPVEGVKEQTGIDLIDYIKKELPTEDVELHYDTHIVTITGFFQTGENPNKKNWVKYRDDEMQGPLDNGGDASEKTAELKKNDDGTYSFRRKEQADFHKVRVVVSESVPSRMKGGKDDGGNIRLVWDSMGLDARYDLIGGNLADLRENNGDFSSTTTTRCLLNDLTSTEVLLSLDALEEQVWFLHRSVIDSNNGSYNSEGLSQVNDRDTHLQNPIQACPTCPHSKCFPGEPMRDPICDAPEPSMGIPNGCVGQVCQQFPSCCEAEWDVFCVEQAQAACSECLP